MSTDFTRAWDELNADAAELAGSLLQLMSDCERARHPEHTDSTIVADANRLPGLVQRVLESTVVYARATGTTWTEIGDSLGGITRQSAHKRFKDAVERFREAPPESTELFAEREFGPLSTAAMVTQGRAHD
ncbi:hypothetical protein [Amycolatopsis thailandensis]|uniref:hypothetical protein n=1 Tax=Amycolatopsis thailandensis TaxID=589330 RepID=UPI00363CA286